jgi:hypothetical protein
MRSFNVWRAAAAAMVVAGGLTVAMPAWAVPFSVDATSPNDDTDTLLFNQFDPSLGTLSAVVFFLNTETRTVGIEISASGAGGIIAVANGTATFEVVGPNGTLFAGTGTASSNCFDVDSAGDPDFACTGSTVSSSVSPIPANTTELPPDLAPYIGIGQFSVDVTALANDPSFDLCVDPSTGGQGSCSGTTSAIWTGDLSVAFRFVADDPPTDVPAPTTLALLAAALTGFGAVRRRR